MSTSQRLCIGEWLNSINPGYYQYKTKFEDEGISFVDDFSDLTNDTEIDCFFIDIGITKILHQKRLKREIKTIIASLKHDETKQDTIGNSTTEGENEGDNTGDWTCKLCTFINYKCHALTCEMCGTKRFQTKNPDEQSKTKPTKGKSINEDNELKIELKVDSDTDDDDDVNTDSKETDSKETDNDEFKEWDNLDNGFSRNLIVALSNKKTVAKNGAAMSAACGIIPGALNTTATVTNNVTTTTMQTVMQRHDVIKWGFHHHYYTTSQVPVTTTQQVTSVVPLAKGVVIGHAAIGAGIASAAMFSLQLGWDLFQYKEGNISKDQLKMRTIKSATTNGSVLVSSVAGSAIGTAIAPGIGTIIGGIIGSIAGVVASIGLNKKWDEHFQKKYPDEFKNFNMDIPDDPEKVLREAALMFGFKEKYLKDKKVFNAKSVKRRYKKLAREFHPDFHGNHESFIEFHTNYTILLTHLKEQ